MHPKCSRLVFLAGLLAPLSGAHAAEIVIDTFMTAQSTTGVVDGAGILGGERDASVNGGNLLNISGGTAQMNLPSDQTGLFIILTWDGNDGSTTVGYLLNEDLTDGGSNDRFYLGISAVSGTVQGNLYIAEDQALYGSIDFPISATGIIEIPFDSIPLSDPSVDFAGTNHLRLRMIMDPGESITVNKFSVGPADLGQVFEDGFEPEP